MIDIKGSKDQLIRIRRRLSGKCQLLLFSDTCDEPVMKFAHRIVREPNLIRVRSSWHL